MTNATMIKIRERGVLTLPKKVRDRLEINAGDVVKLVERNGKLVIAPLNNYDPVLEDLKQALDDMRNNHMSPAFSSGRELAVYMKSKKTKTRG